MQVQEGKLDQEAMSETTRRGSQLGAKASDAAQLNKDRNRCVTSGLPL